MNSVEVRTLSKSFQIHRGPRPARFLVDEIGQRARALLRRLGGNGDAAGLETFWALQDVDFTVEAGTAVGLIGSNGSGKSTLLKILSRITLPTRGSFRLVGRVSSLLEVGMGFHPELTARQNIFLNGAILGMRRREIARKLDEIVEFAGVAQFLDEPVKHFSSGMYTRLAFSVAAFLESEILLVDEVLAVGDAAFQEKCLHTMRHAARAGRTVVFVSHNMAAVGGLTQRTLVLDRGRVAYQGSTPAAIAHYLKRKQDETFRGLVPTAEIARRAQAHYRLMDEGLYIDEMGLAEGQGSEIHPGASLRMGFVIRADRPRQGVRIAYTINTVTGQAVLTGLSPPFAVQAGRQRVDLRIADLRLVPGEYQFSIYLGTGNWHELRREHDMYVGFGRLTVSSLTGDGRTFGEWDRLWAPAYHVASELERVEPQA